MATLALAGAIVVVLVVVFHNQHTAGNNPISLILQIFFELAGGHVWLAIIIASVFVWLMLQGVEMVVGSFWQHVDAGRATGRW